MRDEALAILETGIEKQKAHLEQWRQPVEPLLFETLRTIDALYFEELFFSADSSARTPLPQHTLSTWGVNKALSLMVPKQLDSGPFRLFPSTGQTQAQAAELLLQCGILQRAETLYGWLREGLLSARIDRPAMPLESGTDTILVLKSAHPSMFSEVISRKHKRWISDLTIDHDSVWKHELQQRHTALAPALEEAVTCFGGWGISYTTTREIDDHFLECGQIYLRRMWSQDLLGTDEVIGGEAFGDYLGVLTAVAGRAEKQLCFASILKRRHPELRLENLLTTFAPCDELITGLAEHLDAETTQIKKLLSYLVLGPDNLDVHTDSGEIAWAPIARSSADYFLLPLYGLDTNPFLFLLTELQARHREDWFRAANNRERRWLADLKHLFASERWVVNDRNLKLREGKKTVTDLDFISYDKTHNELALFQLKWQHPVGIDNRARRSAGKNLLSQGNDWVERVMGWISRNGVDELAKRAGIAIKPDIKVRLFVIGRYNAYFTGFSDRDERATWADWNHLMKARLDQPQASVSELCATLKAEADEISTSYKGDSYVVPLGNVAVLLNPVREPTSS
ncbi:hypothetical protein [Labrenzia sp. R5_0]|uniref:hypothetical protein n=1 Tax=Labrenzia sp. R5_0 TaxID=2821108 RepID=UPI001ADB91CE|nr:hypothetical protein [Labrenzia sp. R5_0]MBO9460674.1 hypothetical protein [Labrenzia sp. R5_0]